MEVLWNQLIVNPFTNILLLFYDFLGNNFFLALAVFTVLTRLAMLPLNLRQQRSMMAQQELQPKIQEIQKKYKDDQQKMLEEFQKIGYNPAQTLVGCLPLVITFPIFIGLYRAIQFTLASTPIALYQLSERAYSFVDLTPLLPVSNRFAWLNLAQPDPIYILPLLVVATMFLSQRFMMPSQDKKDEKKGKEKKNDDPTAATMKSMQYTMPAMFGLFSLQFPAGVSIYFVFSNLISMLQGYIVRQERAKAKAELEEKKRYKSSNKSTSAELAESSESNSSSQDAQKKNGQAGSGRKKRRSRR
jgi:YidC/Oxa1 family membrane protein insertase